MPLPEIPVEESLRLLATYLDHLPDGVATVGQLAYHEDFRSEHWTHRAYAPTRRDVSAVVDALDDLLRRVPSLERENRAMRYGDSSVLRDNEKLRGRVAELEQVIADLEGIVNGAVPVPRAWKDRSTGYVPAQDKDPIDLYANHCFRD